MKNTGIILYIFAILLLDSCRANQANEYAPGSAMIYPDYMNVTIPLNIAPLNFNYTVSCDRNTMTTFSCEGYEKTFKGTEVRWRLSEWKKLLNAAEGKDILVRSSVADTSWVLHVSKDSIDYGINYRLIEPGYEVYSKMGIYERQLSSFKEKALLVNSQFGGCVNCHSYNRSNPAKFSLHIRGSHGATLIGNETGVKAYDTKTDSTLGFCVYPYWHPTGNYIAYSTNTTRQGFHSGKDKLIEVFDLASDVHIYDVASNQIITSNQLKGDDWWETFPSFSPDGKTLYFCRAIPRQIPNEVTQVRYSLCSIPFDPETGKYGDEIDVLIDAESIGASVSFPRPSHDGKFIVFAMSAYGNFSIWHHEADLYAYDIEEGSITRLDQINSTDTESYHSFSSSGHWMVFSSRRDDGLFTRLYFTHFDENGIPSKPFMLPQKDPVAYYKDLFLSYNVPEFVSGPVDINGNQVSRIIVQDNREKFGQRSGD